MIEPSRLGFYSDIGYKAIETQHMLRLYNWVFRKQIIENLKD